MIPYTLTCKSGHTTTARIAKMYGQYVEVVDSDWIAGPDEEGPDLRCPCGEIITAVRRQEDEDAVNILVRRTVQSKQRTKTS